MAIKFITPSRLDKHQKQDFKSQLGGVHGVHPALPDDTLCSMAISDNTYNAGSTPTDSKITCKDCLAIIKYCKSI